MFVKKKIFLKNVVKKEDILNKVGKKKIFLKNVSKKRYFEECWEDILNKVGKKEDIFEECW